MSLRLALCSAFLAVSALTVGCSGGSTEGANGEDQPKVDELNKKARFTQMKQGPTDPHLGALYAAATKLDNAYLGVYRFNNAGPEATDPVAREKRIKEVMHRYMCSFFDESIDIGRSTGANKLQSTLNDVDMDRNASDQEAAVKTFSDALADVLKEPKLDVLSGSASGNNTGGEIMGVYDVANNEILYFGYTNCGSDD